MVMLYRYPGFHLVGEGGGGGGFLILGLRDDLPVYSSLAALPLVLATPPPPFNVEIAGNVPSCLYFPEREREREDYLTLV